MNKTEQHKKICEQLNTIYQNKNHDYGDSFGKTFQSLGIISALTRITDKYNRAVSLCTKSKYNQKVMDESIEDTFIDMANYCIMTLIELQQQNETEDKSNN